MIKRKYLLYLIAPSLFLMAHSVEAYLSVSMSLMVLFLTSNVKVLKKALCD